jgi:hypothetical protein
VIPGPGPRRPLSRPVRAKVYDHFTRGRPLRLDQKHDIFQVTLACMNNGPGRAHLTVRPRTLSQTRVQQIADYFMG